MYSILLTLEGEIRTGPTLWPKPLLDPVMPAGNISNGNSWDHSPENRERKVVQQCPAHTVTIIIKESLNSVILSLMTRTVATFHLENYAYHGPQIISGQSAHCHKRLAVAPCSSTPQLPAAAEARSLQSAHGHAHLAAAPAPKLQSTHTHLFLYLK